MGVDSARLRACSCVRASLCPLLAFADDADGTGGHRLSADELQHTDGERSAKSLTDLPVRDLFELVDAWGNPIAYFHHADYGRVDVYETFDPLTGERIESNVQAIVNPKLRRPYENRRFQLISAGPDGVFGTEDDIANFRIEPRE